MMPRLRLATSTVFNRSAGSNPAYVVFLLELSYGLCCGGVWMVDGLVGGRWGILRNLRPRIFTNTFFARNNKKTMR
ncbi:hypothetical protein HBI56_029450 [Parastagonospora nodorum]|uniref:Uncharacterized protein n=1 Tax=Phaeosphaeria nodorum (strain SN15 / ATCC MYA-4574 / FGSC 10173) TaxID=321614 RepID=A0A7U2EYN7_PHANO|nr:hypothetical protein HBH56_017060 [Parastagonospora nodorum]QRC95152.1 hypothetical protein JI435_302030 [Parastagonospora nodorum SN15]KAH3937137.1 hypothetical protein HBH54_017410 [Parastagonospora nodorum]KAH3953527.1 hypothetical protein HBH53_029780 [Parastagonospora nodorum]KAH3962608.1 hypothetical protein HBH51_172200 [Parastagonospora nodorum]